MIQKRTKKYDHTETYAQKKIPLSKQQTAVTHIINKGLSLLTQKESNKPKRKCQATDF